MCHLLAQWTASLRSARLGAVRCPSEALSRASPRGVAEALQQVTRQLQQIPLRSSVCFLSLRQPLRVRLMGCEVKHHLLTFLHHVEVSEGSSATVGAGLSVCVAVCASSAGARNWEMSNARTGSSIRFRWNGHWSSIPNSLSHL